MHTDQATIFEDDQLIASAQSRQVPIVSGRQMLTWLDGRNGSSFKNLAWSANALTFSIGIGAGARNLTAMLPTLSDDGLLSSITLDGTPVTYRTETIKGLEYAIFPAAVGTYRATYGTAPAAKTLSSLAATTDSGTSTGKWSAARIGSSDAKGRTAATVTDAMSSAAKEPPASTKPTISDVQAVPLPDGTTSVTWTTDVKAQPTVEYGLSSSVARQGDQRAEVDDRSIDSRSRSSSRARRTTSAYCRRTPPGSRPRRRSRS